MSSGEPPPTHRRSFVQAVFNYSFWPHVGWNDLDNVISTKGLVGRITRQRCTSRCHFWMASKGRKQNQQSSVFLEQGEGLAGAGNAGHVPFRTRVKFCAAAFWRAWRKQHSRRSLASARPWVYCKPSEPENASFLKKLLRVSLFPASHPFLRIRSWFINVYDHCCLELNPVSSAKPVGPAWVWWAAGEEQQPLQFLTRKCRGRNKLYLLHQWPGCLYLAVCPFLWDFCSFVNKDTWIRDNPGTSRCCRLVAIPPSFPTSRSPGADPCGAALLQVCWGASFSCLGSPLAVLIVYSLI